MTKEQVFEMQETADPCIECTSYKTLDQVIADLQAHKLPGYTGRIGYVYPDNAPSYYINSNLNSVDVFDAEDGYLYAEREEEVIL